MNPIARYTHWLHTRWPAGLVEKTPEIGDGGTTAVEGVRIVGDLTGVPLLKFSADTGAKAIQAFLDEPGFAPGDDADPDLYDVAIIGGGVSGMSAALEAREAGLRYVVFEAAERFATIVNFPKGKPIFTYPSEMEPAGDIRFEADIKEGLLAELEEQTRGIETQRARIDRIHRRGGELQVVHANGEVTRARRVILAIGRSGNYRRLGVPGQDLDKVYHRLYDPAEFEGQEVLVVGGGDSALESAIALAQSGARVTLSYRKEAFNRPKPENVERIRALEEDPQSEVQVSAPSSDRVNAASGAFMPRPRRGGSITRMMGSRLEEIREDEVDVTDADGARRTLKNDVVFAMIGREPPLDFFRRSGIPITGEFRLRTWMTLLSFLAFCIFLYHWKGFSPLSSTFEQHGWFPFGVPEALARAFDVGDPATLPGTLAITLKKPGFYYTLAYTLCIIVFGVDRIRRRNTPYVTVQTTTLMAIQVLPLFLLPYILLPWAGHNGAFDQGFLKTAADNLFPQVSYDHGREYWRAFGFILAWPLFIWNLFTDQPMVWWLIIGGVQTFVLIPLLVYFYGKGAYCGWICSCGALAETLGDRHRHKMPHGPFWNRLNMLGQLLLAICAIMLVARVVSWTVPGTIGAMAASLHVTLRSSGSLFGLPILNYQYLVDLWLAGVFGVAFYFWYSGRVWCRFGCPLAALMHIYARFSQFRIFAEKKKCISCNVCTSVCHQGIDIMSFANKGLPMQDPECVRCSACVQQCPTGVLSFGRQTSSGLVALDTLQASAVRARESSART